MNPEDEPVRYHIWCDTKENRVRMDVSGFATTEEAMAFADWLSDIPFEDGGEEVLVH